ncbi:MAG: hypothetical protein WBQ86_16855 [Candidatus Binatus sp.]
MNASKFTNGSEAEVLDKTSQTPPKSAQRSAARAAAKKIGKKATGVKTKTKPPQVKAVRSSTSEKLVCRYCGSDDLAPSFIKRRDRRCRKCFSKRYGSAATTKKAKVKKVKK